MHLLHIVKAVNPLVAPLQNNCHLNYNLRPHPTGNQRGKNQISVTLPLNRQVIVCALTCVSDSNSVLIADEVRTRKSAMFQFLSSLPFLQQNWENLLPCCFTDQRAKLTAEVINTETPWNQRGCTRLMGGPQVSTETAGTTRQGQKENSILAAQCCSCSH